MIVAPRVIRPADKIRIFCTIINKHWQNTKVRALIYTDEQEISASEQILLPNIPSTLGMVVSIFSV